MHIRLREAKSANLFMRFHLEQCKYWMENIAYADSEVLVTPQNADDLEEACDTHNAADPEHTRSAPKCC